VAAGKSNGPGIVNSEDVDDVEDDADSDDDEGEEDVPPQEAVTNINEMINVVIFFIKSPLPFLYYHDNILILSKIFKLLLN
jgi:hypothetical protein